MCLTSVQEEFLRNDDIKIGYKVFDRRFGYYYNPHFDCCKGKRMGSAYKVYSREEGIKLTIWGEDRTTHRYERGFHIFNTLKGARVYSYSIGRSICKVIAWDIRAQGRQDRYGVFIAKNFRLMEDVDGVDYCR